MKEAARAVVGYIRVSTKEQAETKLSLTNQEEKIRSWAKSREDMSLSRIFNDAAESAKDLNRPAVQELLLEVQKGRIGTVVIYKLDRLTRNLENLGALLRIFEKHDVALHAVQESLDTSTASGRMVVNLLGMIAQWERETIAERTQVALDVKRRNGEKLGGIVPFGWRVQKGKLIPNPKESGVLNGILKARREGRGYQDVAETLNEQGVKPRTGRRWYASTIRAICLRAGVQRPERAQR
jgi:site-specific DNA recombinase